MKVPELCGTKARLLFKTFSGEEGSDYIRSGVAFSFVSRFWVRLALKGAGPTVSERHRAINLTQCLSTNDTTRSLRKHKSPLALPFSEIDLSFYLPGPIADIS